MQEAARGLASLGRYGDDTLLHVSRKELQGLRALTGKDFTRNPETGLPEAFSWTSLIPVAAGIAGTVLSGGNVGVGALAAGAASAATAKAEGKSNEQALTQGLISGVTSYAGGQLMSGVGEAATGAAQTAGAEAAKEAAAQAGTQAATQAGTQAATTGAAQGAAEVGAGGLGATVPPGDIIGPIGPAQTYGAAADVGPAAPTVGETISNRAMSAVNTAGDVANYPGAAISKLGQNIADKPFSALMTGAGLYSTAQDMMGGRPAIPGQTPYDPNRYPEQFPENPRTWNAPPAGYAPGYGAEYRYFAKGGLASMRPEGSMTANIMNEAKAALLGEHPRPREALERFENTFGQDALSELRDRITGGRVRGAGGGMDDLVPGTIEGRQKVRLADGEFVVPADVVSGLGDGSTDQGVRRLHEMMNKVREQRTGKAAQPKAIGGKISL